MYTHKKNHEGSLSPLQNNTWKICETFVEKFNPYLNIAFCRSNRDIWSHRLCWYVEIFWQVGHFAIKCSIKKRQLKWFCNIARMNEKRWANHFLPESPEWYERRPQELAHKRFYGNIYETLMRRPPWTRSEITISEATQLAPKIEGGESSCVTRCLCPNGLALTHYQKNILMEISEWFIHYLPNT